MSNQKKNIEELGYARHGYPADTAPKTVRDVEKLIGQLKGQLNNIKYWNNPLSDLLTMTPDEFNELGFDCCHVPSYLKDYPEDLKADDKNAFVFTNRSETLGVQILIGEKSGIIATRQRKGETITDWQYSNSKGISYATFSIDYTTGHLVMHTEPGYSGANFSIKNGHLIVTI